MQRNEGLLLDMKRAATLIREFAEQMSFDEFRADLKTQSAVIHQFLLIGEVAKRLSEDFRKSNPEIPGVDLREIWKASEQEIPKLLSFLSEHLPEQ